MTNAFLNLKSSTSASLFRTADQHHYSSERKIRTPSPARAATEMRYNAGMQFYPEWYNLYTEENHNTATRVFLFIHTSCCFAMMMGMVYVCFSQGPAVGAMCVGGVCLINGWDWIKKFWKTQTYAPDDLPDSFLAPVYYCMGEWLMWARILFRIESFSRPSRMF